VIPNVRLQKKPFRHVVIDDFLPTDMAAILRDDFPDPSTDIWFEYHNPLEVKRACGNWGYFPPSVYRYFMEVCSPVVSEQVAHLFGLEYLMPDIGLHGAGMHSHGNGGSLNPHLDYSIHPKMLLQRRVNLILYLSDWDPSWGGHLGLWEDDGGKPGRLVKEVEPRHNRAVLFDTTENSWHGLSRKVECPQSTLRNSLAMYYLHRPKKGSAEHQRVLFAPTKEQEGDKGILDLIEKRAGGHGRR